MRHGRLLMGARPSASPSTRHRQAPTPGAVRRPGPAIRHSALPCRALHRLTAGGELQGADVVAA
jgi:hypothetical protein